MINTLLTKIYDNILEKKIIVRIESEGKWDKVKRDLEDITLP